MIKSRRYLFIVLVVFIVALFLVGLTFAYFNYTRTTGPQQMIAGDIYLNMVEGDGEITLSNVFPETKEEARERNDNYITFSINGKNTSNKNVYYEFILEHGEEKSSPKTRYNDEDLRIDLIELDSNGNELEYILDNETYDSLVNKRIYTNTVDANTTTELNRYYKIRMWLNENVVISDTALDANYPASGYSNKYATIKLTVLGDLMEKSYNQSLYSIMKKNAVMDNINSDYVNNTTPGIDFGKVSSDTNGKGIYTRAGTENDTYPIMYYRGAVENNNVLFNNLCWKAVRTTDTGGIKLIYNGGNKGTIDSPNCNNTSSSTIIASYVFNTNYNSPAYVGYMFGDVYTYNYGAAASGAYYGSGFTYANGVYALINPSTIMDNTHHYTCNSTTLNGTCETIRYYYLDRYYVNLTGGDSIEKAIEKMQTNTTNSLAKNVIDSWYSSVMNIVTNKLEDTIWCNDRSMGNGNNNGWIANGGDLNTYLYYGARERSNNASEASTVKNKPSLICLNKNDAFTVKSGKGNGKLTYPVALLTEDEMVLAGGVESEISTFYLDNGYTYNWSLSPSAFTNTDSRFFAEYGGIIYDKYVVNNSFGLRPSVSLKPGTKVLSGNGAVTNPYVIE